MPCLGSPFQCCFACWPPVSTLPPFLGPLPKRSLTGRRTDEKALENLPPCYEKCCALCALSCSTAFLFGPLFRLLLPPGGLARRGEYWWKKSLHFGKQSFDKKWKFPQIDIFTTRTYLGGRPKRRSLVEEPIREDPHMKRSPIKDNVLGGREAPCPPQVLFPSLGPRPKRRTLLEEEPKRGEQYLKRSPKEDSTSN